MLYLLSISASSEKQSTLGAEWKRGKRNLDSFQSLKKKKPTGRLKGLDYIQNITDR